MSGCEGGCGCALVAGWEIAATPEPRGERVAEHTPARCRAIRALREAGQTAVGRDGSAFVCHLPQVGFLVRAWTPGGAWAECPVLDAAVVGVAQARLDIAATAVVRRLLAEFEGRPNGRHPRGVVPTALLEAPLLSRDPHLGAVASGRAQPASAAGAARKRPR